LLSAYWHVTNWETALAKTTATGVLFPNVVLIVATVLLGIGGLCLLLGYKTRVGAVLLIIEIVATACIFYPFWTFEGAEMQLILLAFLIRMALCGGLLVLLNSGPGTISIDSNND